MLYRCILSPTATEDLPKAREGRFSNKEIAELNSAGYNIYFLPNYPSHHEGPAPVKGSDIDVFQYVMVDMDLKDGDYRDKESFIATIGNSGITPTTLVDSGNGVHAFWRVSDLDAKSYLRLQRRLMRKFNTDPAIDTIYRLMRVPGTKNTKDINNIKECIELYSDDISYTCEELDKLLPPITKEDEAYCQNHYDKTYDISQAVTKVNEKLPHKFVMLMKNNREAKSLFTEEHDDRSRADYRLAHLLLAEGLTKDEMMSVLINCKKALQRTPVHRINYAANIVDKVWIAPEETDRTAWSSSVRDILLRGNVIQGTRLPCWEVFDGTVHGFRLGHVLGLIGGAGSGKTTLALNYFYHFTRLNPEYEHLFVSLEQPEEEIALRWAKIAQGKEHLHSKVHVLGNYNKDGTYRNLALHQIQDYVLELEKRLDTEIGCVVIDHVGVLRKESKEGESQGLIDIFHGMKAFAKATNTFLVMQSQTNRTKAGIGDLELDKDAAYGSTLFEWYCDFIVTTWQPLKRIYDEAAHMACSAFKYAKIRHKDVIKDNIKEDVVHVLMFNPKTEKLTEMTAMQEEAFETFSKRANVLRNRDRKSDPTKITRITWTGNKEAPGG